MKHIQDAMETYKPWELWQYKNCDVWVDLNEDDPAFYSEVEYRRKPKTININGIEVPAPEREPLKEGDSFYCLHLNYSHYDHYECTWHDTVEYFEFLNKGLIYKKMEDMIMVKNAILSLLK
jgi:hypothetical protein